MFGIVFTVVFLILGQDSVTSVRLVELRVRATEREGGTSLLGCQYDLGEDVLYSVDWYKDGMEFFRYAPKNNPQMIAFKRPGIDVDMSRSSSTEVALKNLTQESEGDYKCEVSGEFPNFSRAMDHKRITVYLLPDSGPYITGLQEYYFLDQTAKMKCTSGASRPITKLKWLLNGQEVPESYLGRSWQRPSAVRTDAFETTLELSFIVKPKHFKQGRMNLECQATIAPLYQRRTNSTHYIGLPDLTPNKHGLLVEQPLSGGSPDTIKHSNVFFMLISAFILNLL